VFILGVSVSVVCVYVFGEYLWDMCVVHVVSVCVCVVVCVVCVR